MLELDPDLVLFDRLYSGPKSEPGVNCQRASARNGACLKILLEAGFLVLCRTCSWKLQPLGCFLELPCARNRRGKGRLWQQAHSAAVHNLEAGGQQHRGQHDPPKSPRAGPDENTSALSTQRTQCRKGREQASSHAVGADRKPPAPSHLPVPGLPGSVVTLLWERMEVVSGVWKSVSQERTSGGKGLN